MRGQVNCSDTMVLCFFFVFCVGVRICYVTAEHDCRSISPFIDLRWLINGILSAVAGHPHAGTSLSVVLWQRDNKNKRNIIG